MQSEEKNLGYDITTCINLNNIHNDLAFNKDMEWWSFTLYEKSNFDSCSGKIQTHLFLIGIHPLNLALFIGHITRVPADLLCFVVAWWRHQMKTFAALLAICAGNSPVTGEFPAQRPVMRSFDIFFDLRLYKRLSKQSWAWWFETPSRPLWRHCYGLVQFDITHSLHDYPLA